MLCSPDLQFCFQSHTCEAHWLPQLCSAPSSESTVQLGCNMSGCYQVPAHSATHGKDQDRDGGPQGKMVLGGKRQREVGLAVLWRKQREQEAHKVMGSTTRGRRFQNWVWRVFTLGKEQSWKPTGSVENTFNTFFFFYPPILSGLKVQAKIHSLSCHCISLFLQLLLGRHITNLVGRESREQCNLELYY